MASLYVIQGRDMGRRFELDGGALTIGRDGVNAIQLHDTEVSRRHAEIRREGTTTWVVDLGSSNGTFVNGERIQRHSLKSGDRVQTGRTLLIFTGADVGAGVPPQAVDIVGTQRGGESSRIVKTLPQDSNSDIFGSPATSESPWLARARSNLEIMYHTALAASHTLEIGQLLDRILELIFEWVEADRGCIMLIDRESNELMPRARRHRAGHDERMLISRTILDYVMGQKEGVLTSDAREDDRWDAGGSIVKYGVREAICVPMQGRYGIVGVIYIDTFTPPGKMILKRSGDKLANRFQEEHLKLMVAIGHQAALAVEDTSYYSAMVQAERLAAIGQTIATLSHHIKNILQGISSGSYLIEEGLKTSSSEAISKGWRIVERNQDKISHLVMDMLSFGKAREPDLAPTDLNEVAGDVVELMQSRAAEHKVKLDYQPAADLPELLFDAEGLHRAILNVVTNAIDASEKTPGGGHVVLATKYDTATSQATITVEDNGVGIPAEDLQTIFQAFVSRKGSRGTGLGLPVSQKILREHGGDVTVASEVGRGSIFTLKFPAQAATGPGTGVVQVGKEKAQTPS